MRLLKKNKYINKSLKQFLKYKTMSSYCLQCRKNTESKNLRVLETDYGETMILSKCAICGSKKVRFIKKQEASGILSNLGLKVPLNKIPLLSDNLFRIINVNEIVNKFLLAGDKFITKMHLKQPGCTYISCVPFTKDKERIQKFKRNRKYKICLQKRIR